MFQRWIHFSCCYAWVAAFLVLMPSMCGCALWNKDRWNLDRYRDERAVDIEQRLDGSEPIVENPF